MFKFQNSNISESKLLISFKIKAAQDGYKKKVNKYIVIVSLDICFEWRRENNSLFSLLRCQNHAEILPQPVQLSDSEAPEFAV